MKTSLFSGLFLMLSMSAGAQTLLRVESHLIHENGWGRSLDLKTNLANPADVKKLTQTLSSRNDIYTMDVYRKGIKDFQIDLEKKRHEEIKDLITDFKPKKIHVKLGLIYDPDNNTINSASGKDLLLYADHLSYGHKTAVTVRLEGGDPVLNNLYKDNQTKIDQLIKLTSSQDIYTLLDAEDDEALEAMRTAYPLMGVAVSENAREEKMCDELLVSHLNPFADSLLEDAIEDLRDKRAKHLHAATIVNRRVTAALKKVIEGSNIIKPIK